MKDRWVMHYEMVVLLTITMIAVTIAWFTFSQSSTVKGMFLSTGEAEDAITLTLTENGTESKENIISFYGDELKLQPGSSGSFDLYVTANLKDINQYEIQYRLSKEAFSEEEKNSDLLQAIKNHILFYGANEKGQYKNQLKEDEPLTGELSFQKEQKITIYWTWPYEYKDIPGITTTDVTPEQSTNYDIEDTMIGNELDKIQFFFQVKGKTDKEKESE